MRLNEERRLAITVKPFHRLETYGTKMRKLTEQINFYRPLLPDCRSNVMQLHVLSNNKREPDGWCHVDLEALPDRYSVKKLEWCLSVGVLVRYCCEDIP